MQLVGAVLGHNVHDRARGPPILRQKLVREQVELLDHVGIVHDLLPPGHARIIGVLAVDHEVIAARAHPVRRKVRPVGENRVSAVELAHARRGKRIPKDIAKTAAAAIRKILPAPR